MSRKAFQVQIELEIQAVTCPGVWLCTNGKISLHIYMLESCVQSANYKPNFPIKCNQIFVFHKTFHTKHQLSELEKEFRGQWIYIELVQWQTCKVGNLLASFQTTLNELLYPSAVEGSVAGVDLDLLMEPSDIFPGKVAPKIELSTKTTIKETLCASRNQFSSIAVINPKLLISNERKTQKNIARKVCHSLVYSKKRRNYKPGKDKPIFCYRKAEDDLIIRKPEFYWECSNDGYSSTLHTKRFNRKRLSLPQPKALGICLCKSGDGTCPVCSKYKGYFGLRPHVPYDEMQNKKMNAGAPRTSLFSPDKNVTSNAHNNNSFYNQENRNCDLSDSEVANEFENVGEKPSLTKKLHAKLMNTINSIPKTINWAYEQENKCNCCDYCIRTKSTTDIYHELQKFYGNLCEKKRAQVSPESIY